MRRNWVLAFLLVFAISSFTFAEDEKFKPGSEPDGFRGIKWGTDINTLEEMKCVGTDLYYGGTKTYIREVDKLEIGSATLEKIEYDFWKGKFWSIRVITKDYWGRSSVNWSGLKDAIFAEFGRGHQPDKSVERYYWRGEKTGMHLEYDKVKDKGEIYMFSKEISKEWEEWAKN